MLEPVEVHKQQRACLVVAFEVGQHALCAAAEHRSVGQTGEHVKKCQLVNALAGRIAFDGQRTQVQAGVHQSAVQFIGAAGLAKVKSERAYHLAAVVKDGARPARPQAAGCEKPPVVCPPHVGGDVDHLHGLTQKRRRATRSRKGSDGRTIQRGADVGRKPGRSQRMQPALVIHPQNGGRHLWRNALHLAADQGHQVGQRQLVDHAFEHAPLQDLVHLRERDVGQHRDAASGPSRCVTGGVDDHGDPQRLAILAVQQGVHAIAALRGHVLTDFFKQFWIGMGPKKHGAEEFSQHFLGAEPEQAGEAFVDVHHVA
ncbi:hypothetical protein D3C71_1370220 [compost metagenome]